MKLNKIIFVFTFVLLSLLTVISASAEEDKMYGVWVSTVYNLDYPNNPTTNSETLKNEIDQIVKTSKEIGFNTIFFQVRPCADSFYPSDFFPWSKFLTGTNGIAPDNGFDPLKYFIEKCHENSMDIHAWVNPYRVTKDGDAELNSLSADHPAKINPGWLVKYSDGNYYFNPGIPEVQDYVYGGVAEILQNYEVDGVHLDDYFYPGPDFNDQATYQKYNNGQFSNIADWRRNNVDNMVRSLHNLSGLYGVDFGISPIGIWDNKKSNSLGSNTNGRSSYTQLFADSRGWVKKGYVDYIAPQVYWNFGNDAADYGIVTKWWEDVCKDTDVKLYIGLATYRGEGADVNSPWYGGKETLKQMEYNSTSPVIDGEIHFRYKFVRDNSDIKTTIKTYYNTGSESSSNIGNSTENEQPVVPPVNQSTPKNEITVYVNGKKVEFDTPPIAENGRTLVPMRAVFEALGATVEWEEESNSAVAVKGDNVMEVQVGSYVLKYNGERYLVDTPAKIVNNRTLMPLRAISEIFGYGVEWDQDTYSVYIEG